MLGGVDGSLHFTLPSMNRLNQTEPATFAILLFWAFFSGSFFLYFIFEGISDIKSKGVETSRPRIRMFGLIPVV